LAISKALIRSSEFQRAESIQIYLSNSEEVQSDFLIQEAIRLKKKVLVPLIDPHQHRMFFSELTTLDPNAFEAGPFGIRQLRPGVQKKIDQREIGLWVIPGLAFGLKGQRIGYGGGYYDKVLQSCQTTVIGLAFECQILEHLPQEPQDFPVDQVVTEARTIFCREGSD